MPFCIYFSRGVFNMEYSEDFSFFNSYLTEGEYILWRGKPQKISLFSPSDIILLPFSIMWLSFSIFWEILAIKSGSSIFFALWGLPFILIGLYMLFGGFIRRLRIKNKTFYAVTNKKVIIKKGQNIEMYGAEDLPPMSIKLHKNGNGTIIFRQDIYSRRSGTRVFYFSFENIPDYIQAQNAVNRMDKSTRN